MEPHSPYRVKVWKTIETPKLDVVTKNSSSCSINKVFIRFIASGRLSKFEALREALNRGRALIWGREVSKTSQNPKEKPSKQFLATAENQNKRPVYCIDHQDRSICDCIQGVLWKILTGVFHFWISMTTCFRRIGWKRHPASEFLANNNTMWCHFIQKFAFSFPKLSYIFSNFANGNGNVSTFETIWLILTLHHTFNEEIGRFPRKILPCFRILLQNWYPALGFSGKKHSQQNGTSLGTPT